MTSKPYDSILLSFGGIIADSAFNKFKKQNKTYLLPQYPIWTIATIMDAKKVTFIKENRKGKKTKWSYWLLYLRIEKNICEDSNYHNLVILTFSLNNGFESKNLLGEKYLIPIYGTQTHTLKPIVIVDENNKRIFSFHNEKLTSPFYLKSFQKDFSEIVDGKVIRNTKYGYLYPSLFLTDDKKSMPINIILNRLKSQVEFLKYFYSEAKK